MADFILSTSAVKTAYDGFVTAKAATATALMNLNTAISAQPQPPTAVVVDNDWNNYVAALDTWQTNKATLQATYAAALVAQRTAEEQVIQTLGWLTGDTPTSICLDQWVKVVGAGGGVLTYTNWIGASVKSTYLSIQTVQPTQAYPLF